MRFPLLLTRGKISVLRLEPQDVIIISIPGYCTATEAETIKEQARSRWPGHDVAVLTDGMTISRITATPA